MIATVRQYRCQFKLDDAVAAQLKPVENATVSTTR